MIKAPIKLQELSEDFTSRRRLSRLGDSGGCMLTSANEKPSGKYQCVRV